MDINSKNSTVLSLRDLGEDPNKYGFKDIGEVLDELFSSRAKLHPLKITMAVISLLCSYFGEIATGVICLGAFATLISWIVDHTAQAVSWIEDKFLSLLEWTNPGAALALKAARAAASVGSDAAEQVQKLPGGPKRMDANVLYSADPGLQGLANPQMLKGIIEAAMPVGMGALLSVSKLSTPRVPNRNTSNDLPSTEQAVGRFTAAAVAAAHEGQSVAQAIQKVITEIKAGVASDINPSELMDHIRKDGVEIHPVDAAVISKYAR